MAESGVEAKAAKSLLIHKYCRRHTSTFLFGWKYKLKYKKHKYKISKTPIQKKHCKSAKLPWHYNIKLSFWSSSFWLHVFSDFCLFDLVSCSCFYFLFCLFSVLLTLCLFDLLSFQHFIFLICCLLNLWSFRLFVFFYFVSFEFLSFWMFLIVWLFCLFDFSEGPKPGTLRIFKFLLQNNCFP